MITKLYVSNYRSIGPGLELELDKFTVLVGPNGSGKSNIADALRFLADCVNTSLDHAIMVRRGFGTIQRWSVGRSVDVSFRLEIGAERGEGSWEFTLTRSGEEDAFRVKSERARWRPFLPGNEIDNLFRKMDREFKLTDNDEDRFKAILHMAEYGFERSEDGWQATLGYLPAAAVSEIGNTTLALPLLGSGLLAPLADEVRRIAIYSIFPNTLHTPQNPNPARPMTSNGDNWASTLKALNKDTWGVEFLAALNRIVGDVDDYRIVLAGGFLIPEFRHGTGGAKGRERWLSVAQESDGTLRVAAILTALFQEPPPSLIGFEEPEIAVHPGALPVLFDFLNEATRRSRILLTTHSPDLLDLLSIEDIRVVERRDGVTAISPVDDRQRELVRKRLLSTSDLLHAEGLRAEGARDDG